MPNIEVDADTARALTFAARMAGMTPGQLVTRLVARASLLSAEPGEVPESASDRRVAIYADYEDVRTDALFDVATGRVDVTSGPLAGRGFKTPTGAARAVVAHYKPGVSPHRNGWSFWFLSEDGRALQTIRHSDGHTP